MAEAALACLCRGRLEAVAVALPVAAVPRNNPVRVAAGAAGSLAPGLDRMADFDTAAADRAAACNPAVAGRIADSPVRAGNAVVAARRHPIAAVHTHRRG